MAVCPDVLVQMLDPETAASSVILGPVAELMAFGSCVGLVFAPVMSVRGLVFVALVSGRWRKEKLVLRLVVVPSLSRDVAWSSSSETSMGSLVEGAGLGRLTCSSSGDECRGRFADPR